MVCRRWKDRGGLFWGAGEEVEGEDEVVAVGRVGLWREGLPPARNVTLSCSNFFSYRSKPRGDKIFECHVSHPHRRSHSSSSRLRPFLLLSPCLSLSLAPELEYIIKPAVPPSPPQTDPSPPGPGRSGGKSLCSSQKSRPPIPDRRD